MNDSALNAIVIEYIAGYIAISSNYFEYNKSESIVILFYRSKGFAARPPSTENHVS